MDNYLQVLEESLKKKREVLRRIEVCAGEQEEILKAENVPEDAFEASLEQKGRLIDELNSLDTGFEQLYERIRVQLLEDKSKYAEPIRRLKLLIQEVTQQSVAIQAQEQRNKELAEAYFARSKQELRKSRINSKAAMNYYKNVNGSGYILPQVMDQKK